MSENKIDNNTDCIETGSETVQEVIITEEVLPDEKAESGALDKVKGFFKKLFSGKTMKSISEALDEDVSEIETLSETPKEHQTEETIASKKNAYNRRVYLAVGIIFTLMALIGLISVVNFSVRIFTRFTENAAQKENFANYIYPVVVMDMSPFDNDAQLSDEQIITAAIWDLIVDGDFDKYEKNIDVITVPQVDIEQHAAKLFGDGLTFEHKSFKASSITFYYDAEKKAYNIPISPTYYSYIPTIEDIEKDSSKQFTLLVAYKRDRPSWLEAREHDSPIAKYMRFVVEKTENGYQILSMKNVSEEYNINAN